MFRMLARYFLDIIILTALLVALLSGFVFSWEPLIYVLKG